MQPGKNGWQTNEISNVQPRVITDTGSGLPFILKFQKFADCC